MNKSPKSAYVFVKSEGSRCGKDVLSRGEVPITRLTRARGHRRARARAGELAARLKPLATDRMPLDVPPPRTSRFGSPRVHWCDLWLR